MPVKDHSADITLQLIVIKRQPSEVGELSQTHGNLTYPTCTAIQHYMSNHHERPQTNNRREMGFSPVNKGFRLRSKAVRFLRSPILAGNCPSKRGAKLNVGQHKNHKFPHPQTDRRDCCSITEAVTHVFYCQPIFHASAFQTSALSNDVEQTMHLRLFLRKAGSKVSFREQKLKLN